MYPPSTNAEVIVVIKTRVEIGTVLSGLSMLAYETTINIDIKISITDGDILCLKNIRSSPNNKTPQISKH